MFLVLITLYHQDCTRYSKNLKTVDEDIRKRMGIPALAISISSGTFCP